MEAVSGWVEIGPQYIAGQPHGTQFVRPSGVPGEFEYWFRPCSPAGNCQECIPEVTVLDVSVTIRS